MQLFSNNLPFVFNYPTTDMTSGLDFRASIFDVSTGSPVFVTTIPLTEIQNGFYSGTYNGLAAKTYLAIVLNYISNVVDPNRAPLSECYKSVTASDSFFAFNYGAFDQDETLFLGANIFDCTSGTPIFFLQVAMNHVLGGVYFGSFNLNPASLYDILKFVYQDIGLTMIDSNWSPGSDTTQFLSVNSISAFLFESAILKGQSLKATLTGQSLIATLKESI